MINKIENKIRKLNRRVRINNVFFINEKLNKTYDEIGEKF